jgi:hypothetical protein
MLHLVNKSLGGLRSKAKDPKSDNNIDSATTSPACSSVMMQELNPHSFPQFCHLGHEIRRYILLFVADGPMEGRSPVGASLEGSTYLPCSLTSTLPRVNREFRQLSSLDYFWKPLLMRQLIHKENGYLWLEGMSRLLALEEYTNVQQQLHRQNSALQSNSISPQQLLKDVRAHMEEELTYKQLYRKIYTTHIQFDAPVFAMPCHLRIGQVYSLHLFEPRYRIMIHDLMHATENPEVASSGGTIQPRVRDGVVMPPLLIHANLGSRLAPGENACLVQVVRCNTYEHGQADVQLLPVAWCRLDRIWVRPNAGHLFDARVTRLPSQREFYNTESAL